MRRHVIRVLMVASALLLLGVAAACGSSSEPGGEEATPTGEGAVATGGVYHEVDPAGLRSMLAAKDFLLVNVHIPYEGEIEDTDLFIPYDQVEAHLGELPGDTGAKIVLYCRSGRMSAIAAEVLAAQGYTNLWDLTGGMIAWEEAGYPIVQASH